MSVGPLAGCKVLVTRPSAQAEPLCRAIHDAGAEPVAFPVIRIVPRPAREIAADLAGLPRPDVAIFVSRNAVLHGLAAVRDSGARLAAVGPATAAAIAAGGAEADIVPVDGADSERLLAMPDFDAVAGRSVVIVRGESGRELLADTLRARGAIVHYLAVYRREREAHPGGEIEAVAGALRRGEIDFTVVLSVETVQRLLALLPAPAGDLLRKTTLVAPGERVIQGACKLVPGVQVCRASGPTAADLVSAMIDRRETG